MLDTKHPFYTSRHVWYLLLCTSILGVLGHQTMQSIKHEDKARKEQTTLRKCYEGKRRVYLAGKTLKE